MNSTPDHQIKSMIHSFTLEDGSTNEMTIWVPNGEVKSVYLLLPAMGVRASYYHRFCAALAENGMAVASFDWRGHDKSSVRAGRRQDWGYVRLIEETQYYCQWLKNKYDFERVMLLGHSLGGQVAHLVAARNPKLIDGVVTIASSEPYYKNWKPVQSFGFYIATVMVYPISLIVGHFPGYVFGFAKRESRTMIRDWGKAARKGYFKFKKEELNYLEAKKKYPGFILAISIEDDFFAPKAAVDYSLKKFQKAKFNKHVHLTPSMEHELILDHFNWVKHSQRVIDTMLVSLHQ